MVPAAVALQMADPERRLPRARNVDDADRPQGERGERREKQAGDDEQPTRPDPLVSRLIRGLRPSCVM
jgi:hypothetical protein